MFSECSPDVERSDSNNPNRPFGSQNEVMITAFEYNPSQVYFKQGFGGIYTGNYITSDGTFHKRPNSHGWTTLCYGDMEQIDALTAIIQPLIYKLSKEAHRPISADSVKQLVTSHLPQFPDIKMFE